MPDTPLHERRGIRWLMTQPEWPTNRKGEHLVIFDMEAVNFSGFGWAFTTRWPEWDGSDVSDDDFDGDLAHALLRDALTRALWRHDYETKRLAGESVVFIVVRKWRIPRADDYKGQQFIHGTTDLLALLAAVEEVCVPEDFQ